MASVQDIYNEIDRIENAKSGIAEAIEEKGVEVPEGTMIQDFPAKVRQIQQGSPDAVLFTPQDLTPEQQGQARQNIGAGTYTKPNTGIPATDFAQGVQTSLEKANTAVQPSALTPITDLIPEQATPQNQLADKNFVNSSVATNTANYISDNGQPFQSVADLEAYTGTLTNNDYAFVVGTDSAGNTTYTRYKYNANTGEWAEEYVLNNSSFTAEQWAAISSGITALLVQKLSELPTEIVTYVAQTLTEAQKQQARTNIGATAPEIFVCTHGVTTFDEVKAAYHAGKLCVCDRNGNYYVFAIWQGDNASCYFSCAMTGRIFYLGLNPNNTWFNSSYILELTSNKSQSIPTDRESTTKYPSVKAVADALGKWGVVSQTFHFPPGASVIKESYTITDPIMGIIPQSFIDMVCGGSVDGVCVFNEDTGYFEMNGINNIAYDEMQMIWYFRDDLEHFVTGDLYYMYTDIINEIPKTKIFRTLYPNTHRNIQITNSAFRQIAFVENIRLIPQQNINNYVWFGNSANLNYIFYNGAPNLRKILTPIRCNTNTTFAATATYFQCPVLEIVYIENLHSNFNLSMCQKLLLESIVYMIEKATNTTAITITLHATAYARCQADTTEYEYNGQTYTGIIAYAAARNITIASA